MAPITVVSMPMALAQLDRLGEVARGDLRPRAPPARSRSITGRSTRTCGEFVRSTQTRIRTPTLPSSRDAALRAPRSRLDHGQARQLGDDRRRRPRPAGDLRADDAREHVHPDPVGADDAVRRLQRRQGHVLADRGRQRSRARPTCSARASPTRSATTAASKRSSATTGCTSSSRTCDWADRWFEKYGAPAVFFSRMLPIVRTFISLPAGAARMPFGRFVAVHRRSAASPGCSG